MFFQQVKLRSLLTNVREKSIAKFVLHKYQKSQSRCASRSGCTGELTLYPPRRKTFRLASANIVQERVYRRNSILRHITSFYMRSKREKGILQQQPSYSAFFRDPLANAHSTGIIFWFPCLAFALFIFHITEIITYFW